MSYAFGDTPPAARRLALLARVFEPSSEALLADAGRRGGALAVDLGCGPGHTTELVARVLGCARSVGIDASAAYVDAARARAVAGCEFLCHDVLAAPYPCGPADTLYVRFLLMHLPDPAVAVDVFATQLAPGGRLLLDEVEWIRTGLDPLRRYLSLVEAVLAAQGQELYVGPRIDELVAKDPRTRRSELRELDVDLRDAAGMFSLNWQTLRDHSAVAARTDAAERDRLAWELDALARGEAADPTITWGLRQVVIEA